MLLIAFRHGLRASELVDLRWEQIALETLSCTSEGHRRSDSKWARLL